MTGRPSADRPWWSRSVFAGALVVLMLVPFLWPGVIPLIDLPGHMGRYRIESGIGQSPFLARWWSLHWALIGNLGVDLLVWPLGKLIGIEAATRLVVGAIPALTAIGMLWVARERHGRPPPTAALALPLALGYPFQFGFVNFALSMALAFLAFGLWLRLGRLGRIAQRTALFAAIAPAIWLAHAYGWAVLCLLCAAAELAEALAGGRPGAMRVRTLMGRLLPLAAPLILMTLWRSGTPLQAGGFFDWRGKYGWLESALRDHWKALDGLSVEALVAFLVVGLCGALRVDRVLGLATLLLGAAYLLLPGHLFGSSYADMRLAPYLLAVALLAVAPRPGLPRWVAPLLASAALLFLLVRIGATTASLAVHARDAQARLVAIDHIPPGARVYSLVVRPCRGDWDGTRLEHLPSLAIVRRDAFVNDQWTDDGAETIRVRLPIPPDFASNPSQVVRLPGCNRPEPLVGDRIAHMPHDRFDMVWLIGVPAADRPHQPWLRPVWASADDALYRIMEQPAAKDAGAS